VDHLEVVDALLQLANVLGEVATPVVGDDGGGVLGGAELLQGVEAAINSEVTLRVGGLRLGEAPIQAGTKTVELRAESVEAVNQIVEHLVDDGIHGTMGALKAGEVGMGGWQVLQHVRWPGIDRSDTSVN
jgi:hypothetical protein